MFPTRITERAALPLAQSTEEFIKADLATWKARQTSGHSAGIAAAKIFTAYSQEKTELFLDGYAIEQLPDSICLLTALRTLTLEENNLVSLPTELGNLTNLTMLKLDCNPNLRGLPASLRSIPESLTITIEGTAMESEAASE